MEAIATLVSSGTCIGYLPTHYADNWVARGLLRPIAPSRLAYGAAFHCITRQGQIPKDALEQFMQALFKAQRLLSESAQTSE
ncbi:hypothetical protein D9M71_311550 [compost metagenome]